MARQRRAGEPGAGRPPRAAAGAFDFVLLFSYRYYHAWHGARARAGQGDPRADGGARSGDRPVDLRAGVPRRARAHVQLARGARDDPGGAGNHDVPGVVVGVGSEIPDRTDPGALPAQVQDPPAVRDLHRPDRREQGLRRAVRRTSSATPRRSRAASTSCWSASAIMPIPKHPRIHHLGFSRRPGQVRRARGRRPADHAVVLREPVDGGARGLGARPAGARQRPLRRAEGAVHPQQRRAVLRELPGVRRDAVLARIERPAARAARPQRPRVTSRGTTPGR